MDRLLKKASNEDKIAEDRNMRNKFMIYMVGRSGSGKTTIARALEKELRKEEKIHLQVIDGDIIRQQFGDSFGYTYEERMKCNRAVRVVVQYLLDNDISVILTQVGAYEEMRAKVRGQFAEDYIEIYVECSYEECARRDVKGYYRKLNNGMQNLNGADDIYEIPQNSNIVINTESETVTEAVHKIISYLRQWGYGV